MKPTCPVCHKNKFEIQPQQWVCGNSLCLSSIHHEDAACPECGVKPVQLIGELSCGVAFYLCQNGHEFSQMAKPVPELYRIAWITKKDQD